MDKSRFKTIEKKLITQCVISSSKSRTKIDGLNALHPIQPSFHMYHPSEWSRVSELNFAVYICFFDLCRCSDACGTMSLLVCAEWQPSPARNRRKSETSLRRLPKKREIYWASKTRWIHCRHQGGESTLEDGLEENSNNPITATFNDRWTSLVTKT